MTITIVDQSPNLFWFVCNAMKLETIPLRHIKTVHTAKNNVLSESPKLVIINGDDGSINPLEFMKSIKGHLFYGNTQFIVVTGDNSIENTRKLIMAGASQVLFRARTYDPSSKYLVSLIKWIFKIDEPDQKNFDYQPTPFPAEAELTSYGRMIWISSTHCMIETDIDLSVGQKCEIKNSIFEDLGIKNVKFECVEKNKVGRCYDYAFSVLGKFTSSEFENDQKNLKLWINCNQKFSIPKKIKVMFLEDDFEFREKIAQMVSGEREFSVRGFTDLEDFRNKLNIELPNLVVINRALIQREKAKFEALRAFVRSNFCYCITYSDSELFSIDEFKETYPFAIHVPKFIDLQFLESSIKMMEKKLPGHLEKDNPKLYVSEKSVNSKCSLQVPCKITDLDLSGANVELPFGVKNFSTCEISSNSFSLAEIGRGQLFRIFNYNPKDKVHRVVLLGQNIRATGLLRSALENIKKFGYERWVKNDLQPELKE